MGNDSRDIAGYSVIFRINGSPANVSEWYKVQVSTPEKTDAINIASGIAAERFRGMLVQVDFVNTVYHSSFD